MHPDKTFIGRIERGFDFLGYHFSTEGLTVAQKTIANFIKKASQLYEQERINDTGNGCWTGPCRTTPAGSVNLCLTAKVARALWLPKDMPYVTTIANLISIYRIYRCRPLYTDAIQFEISHTN